MDWKIELVAIPVTDVDRAKAFYVDQVGFHADHDHQVNEKLRFVQLTPPGSACSVVLGTGITEMPPGSQKGIQMVVDDATAARKHLIDHGVEASEVDEQPWGRFVFFSDPTATAGPCRNYRRGARAAIRGVRLRVLGVEPGHGTAHGATVPGGTEGRREGFAVQRGGQLSDTRGGRRAGGVTGQRRSRAGGGTPGRRGRPWHRERGSGGDIDRRWGVGGPGRATAVDVSYPCGVSFGAGALYIAGGQTVRRVNPATDWLTTPAGTDAISPVGDGRPPAPTSRPAARRPTMTAAC